MITLADQIVEISNLIDFSDNYGFDDDCMPRLRAVLASLKWIESNSDWIKRHAILRRDPAVAAILATFPDATISEPEGGGKAS